MGFVGALVAVTWLSRDAEATRQSIATGAPDPLTERSARGLAIPIASPGTAADPDRVATLLGQSPDWVNYTVENGDTLSGILDKLNVNARETYEILALGSDVEPLRRLYPGERLRFRFDSGGRIHQMVYDIEAGRALEIARERDGLRAQVIEHSVERRPTYVTGRVETSFYSAAQSAGLPDRLIMELAEIFGWDIDFALDVREGDRFSVIYEERFLAAHRIGTGNILAAEYTNQGSHYQAIRFVDASGRADYYTREGRPLRKAFLKSPVDFRRITSGFRKERFHPVLGVNRPHLGVDYAAAQGTPVRATGDGRVQFKGVQGGYGKTIVLQHTQGYTTLFAHLSRFATGLQQGARVRQGQVIGYVGKTGLATGPHLHFEFRVNGVYRNPLTMRFPRAEPLAEADLPAFERHAVDLLAQLDVLRQTQVAWNKIGNQ